MLGACGLPPLLVSVQRLPLLAAADERTESRLPDAARELLTPVKNDTRADLALLRAELAEARREAAEARREAAEARLAIRSATREAEELGSYLQRLTAAIHDPTMTLGRLRTLVGSGPANGSLRMRSSD